jgi:ferric-dicitrate binding protein FerR (iron transport regulator)
VLGTSFNINSNSTQTEVTVRSGTVEVKTILNHEVAIIKQNQVAVAEQGRLTISEITNPNYLSWQSGVFEFKNTPITQVIKDLNTYYSVQLELDTMQINNCSLSARFEKSKLEEILQILETTCDCSFIKDKNRIVIK